MKPKFSNGAIQKGRGLICAALLVFGLNTTDVWADGPPAPPEITYTILNFWHFKATNNFATVRGDAPLVATNLLATTNAWGRGAVHVVTNNALLKYRETATNATRAWTNLLVDEGCLRFWFRNHWQSSSLGGTGPGTYARLIEVGDSSATNGYWTLYFHPAGTNLYFASTTNGAVGGVYLSSPIQWESNWWHLITLNYSRSNCQLFIDGEMVCTNIGLAHWPGPNARTNGFTLSGDCRATNLVKGDLADLVTCRGYFSPESVANTFENMAYYYPLGPGVGDSLSAPPGDDLLSGGSLAVDEVIFGGGSMDLGFTGDDHPWLLIPVYQLTNQQTNVLLTIDGGTSNVLYELFCVTNLTGGDITNSTWTLLGYGYSGQTYAVAPLAGWPYTFYTVRGTNDADGDGLTDAYERLVSKTNPANLDSDGDGMPDGWEVDYGLDPRFNDTSGDPDRDGWTNLQEYWGGTLPGAASPMEIFVAHPIGSSNLP